MTILLNVLMNAVSPVRIPLWSTTILALTLVTYWFTGSARDRIDNILRRRRKIAGFAEDPRFPEGDPRRNLSQQFYTLRKANKWIMEQKAKGAISGSFSDVREENVLYPAPYTSTRLKLSITYVLAVLILAVAVQWFIEGAYPDKPLSSSDAHREVYRRFPFWASMILTWVLLAHAELRDIEARKAHHLR